MIATGVFHWSNLKKKLVNIKLKIRKMHLKWYSWRDIKPYKITGESKLLRTLFTYLCIQLTAKDKINSMVIENNIIAVHQPLNKQQKYRVLTWLVFFMKMNILLPHFKISLLVLRWRKQMKTKLSTPHSCEGDICKCRFRFSIVWVTLIVHICSCLKGCSIYILFLGTDK